MKKFKRYLTSCAQMMLCGVGGHLYAYGHQFLAYVPWIVAVVWAYIIGLHDGRDIWREK